MRKDNIKGSLILCLSAFIWGLAFAVQSKAAESITPFAFNSFRSLVGAAFLFAFLKIKGLHSGKKILPSDSREKKTVIKASLICGIMLTLSVNFQQAGISVYPVGVPSAARAGFITALYVIIVPVMSIAFSKKLSGAVWAAVVISMLGIYLLCFSGDLGGIYLGDIFMLLCAVAFSVHIITVDKYCFDVGGVRLSMLQFLVCGLISGILSAVFEWGQFTLYDLLKTAPQILYMGVVSSGIGYTLQIIGQKYAEPAVASISMSFESVFAALGGWIILGNILSLKEIVGCFFMFAAIILAQAPEFFKRKTAEVHTSA